MIYTKHAYITNLHSPLTLLHAYITRNKNTTPYIHPKKYTTIDWESPWPSTILHLFFPHREKRETPLSKADRGVCCIHHECSTLTSTTATIKDAHLENQTFSYLLFTNHFNLISARGNLLCNYVIWLWIRHTWLFYRFHCEILFLMLGEKGRSLFSHWVSFVFR